MKRFYRIHHRRWYDTRKDYLVFGPLLDSLEKARNRRDVSGDLVVDAKTHEVVKDPAWLWDWEKADPKCYAQKAIMDSKEVMQ